MNIENERNPMSKILIINTGGTFNKSYDPINGTLFVDKTSKSLENIASKWLCKYCNTLKLFKG